MEVNKKTLILTDNPYGCSLAIELKGIYGDIDVYQSPNGLLEKIPRINVRKQAREIISCYNLVLSIHCKQIFPKELVDGVRCINVHPGYNPYNRGWFPPVFSIVNNLPGGVTIHEIDEQLDHGPIIVQKRYKIESWDTSGSAYEKLMNLERELVLEWYTTIRDGNYKAILPSEKGNLNLKKDFDNLRYIDLDQYGSYKELINRLRALTHNEFQNAYFIDGSGEKVFVKIQLTPEKAR